MGHPLFVGRGGSVHVAPGATIYNRVVSGGNR
jgi:hypothetical protein